MVADEWNDDKSAANVRADTLLSDTTESSEGDAEIGAASGECPPQSPPNYRENSHLHVQVLMFATRGDDELFGC